MDARRKDIPKEQMGLEKPQSSLFQRCDLLGQEQRAEYRRVESSVFLSGWATSVPYPCAKKWLKSSLEPREDEVRWVGVSVLVATGTSKA